MKVYLIDRQTNEVKQEFDNVIKWGENFVEYTYGPNEYRTKMYCSETELFTSNVQLRLN